VGRRSARVEEHRFVVEGPLLIAEAVEAGWTIEAIFVASGAWSYSPPDGVDVFEMAPNVMERVASTETPQQAIAVVERRSAAVDVLADAGLVVVADRIADPGNAGTILRSAEAAGADAVVFTPGSVDPFNPKVVRASAGAVFHVPVVVDAAFDDVAAAGLRTYGTSSHRGTPYTDADLCGRVALVVGNEAHGLPDDTPLYGWLTIPHSGRAESINVAMAATVVVFEAARQRAARTGDR
jgi:TrmH family RNA methyltransferase